MSKKRTAKEFLLDSISDAIEKLEPYTNGTEMDRYSFIRLCFLGYLTYVIGYWHASIFWIVILFAIWTYSEFRRQERNDRADYIQFTRRMHHHPSLREVLHKAAIPVSMPPWLSFPLVERAHWLNQVLKNMWPYVKIATEGSVRASLDPIFESNCPSFLSSLKLRKFNLGTEPPKITGVTLSEGKDGDVMIDFDIALTGRPQVSVSASTGPVQVVAHLANLRVTGELRMNLKPLTNKWPCFSCLSVSFTRKPLIEFTLKAAKLKLTSIPGLSSWLRKFLQDTVTFYFVWPKKIVVPILEVDKEIIAELWAAEPEGILRVRVLEGKDLSAKHGWLNRVDPFCKLAIGDISKQTAAKKNTLNPKWNESFDFFITDLASQTLEISVYDLDDITGSTISMGETHVPLRPHLEYFNRQQEKLQQYSSFSPKSSSQQDIKKPQSPKSPVSNKDKDEDEGVDMENDADDGKDDSAIIEDYWLPLSSVPRGSVHLQLSWNPFKAVKKIPNPVPELAPTEIQSDAKTNSEDQKTKTEEDKDVSGDKRGSITTTREKSQLPSSSRPSSPAPTNGSGSFVSELFKRKSTKHQNLGLLIVMVHRACHLPAMDLSGKSDPYIELKCGKSDVKKTWVYKKCLDPVWEQQFEFPIKDAKDTLEIVVKDQDVLQDELMGTVKIPLPDPGTKLSDHAFELEVPSKLQKKDSPVPIVRLTLSLKAI